MTLAMMPDMHIMFYLDLFHALDRENVRYVLAALERLKELGQR